jgi:pimeloyl-ACP methyl ester carboxylesterase
VIRALALCLLLVGCSARLPMADDSPLVYDAHAVAQADRIAIFIPGALSSIALFAPAEGWRAGGFAPVYFRFPGLDGRPLGTLDLDQAADQIARFATRHPRKDIALVGYSSGAPIALLAASRITDGRIIPVAAIAPAVEQGGGLPTLARGAADILRATARAERPTPTDIWIEYWQILLFGRHARPDPDFQARVRAAATTQRGERGLGPPDPALSRAHTRAIRRWHLPDSLPLTHLRLRIYAGLEDPVFSTRQTLEFARKLGLDHIHGYPDEGHLLYLTQTDVFTTARRFAEDQFD